MSEFSNIFPGPEISNFQSNLLALRNGKTKSCMQELWRKGPCVSGKLHYMALILVTGSSCSHQHKYTIQKLDVFSILANEWTFPHRKVIVEMLAANMYRSHYTPSTTARPEINFYFNNVVPYHCIQLVTCSLES